MYHDQGLTAFKTLSFSDGVNYTAGLNIVRTSPVHGTAYEIAGQGLADAQSFREAVFMACEIYKKRAEFKLLNENPLEFKSKK
jgi:4-hydroxythreonine-4-phosphate dehydrogenase